MRYIAILASAAALACVAWWLFGWRTVESEAQGRLEYHRFFGRCTRLAADVNRDGRAEMEVFYPWSAPYIGIVDGPCGDSHLRTREDRDLDGRWDTWSVRLDSGPRSPCPLRIAADTDGDGEPDWYRTVPFDQAPEVYGELVAVRGF